MPPGRRSPAEPGFRETVGTTRDHRFNGAMARLAILVEGDSDRAAVLALARALGTDLADSGVVVVAMGGITNTARYVSELGPQGQRLRLAGLYDAREERFVRHGLVRGGFAPEPGSPGLAALGFHRCDRDLEDELIRAVGIDRMLAVLDSEGDLVPFRTLQQQPAHRGGSVADHLHRFLGAGSGRKIRYGSLLVQALALSEVPTPLTAVLADALGIAASEPLGNQPSPDVENGGSVASRVQTRPPGCGNIEEGSDGQVPIAQALPRRTDSGPGPRTDGSVDTAGDR
jgi:hypothetical protein